MNRNQIRKAQAQALPESLVPPYRIEVRCPVTGWQVVATARRIEVAMRDLERLKREAGHCESKILQINGDQRWAVVASYEPHTALYRVEEDGAVWGHYVALCAAEAIELCKADMKRRDRDALCGEPCWSRVTARIAA